VGVDTHEVKGKSGYKTCFMVQNSECLVIKKTFYKMTKNETKGVKIDELCKKR